MPSPFPCDPVIRECSWKKTQIEKKKKKREKSHIPLWFSLKPVLWFYPALFLRALIIACFITKRVRCQSCPFSIIADQISKFPSENIYKLRDCYFSRYAYLKNINKHTWPNHGDIWKPIPVIGWTVSRCNWQIPKRSVQMKFYFRFKRYF